jgi:hypothetical protein
VVDDPGVEMVSAGVPAGKDEAEAINVPAYGVGAAAGA